MLALEAVRFLDTATLAQPHATLAASEGAAMIERRWWHDEPNYREIAEQLDPVLAIDGHTHLLSLASYQPELDAGNPLGLRSTDPRIADALERRFGASASEMGLPAAIEVAERRRAEMIDRLGVEGYWSDHFAATSTEIAIVSQDLPDGIDGRRFRWAANTTGLLLPLPADAIAARSPRHERYRASAEVLITHWLAAAGLDAVPDEVDGYLAFLDRTLEAWKGSGAVGVKFWDAYLRTLAFADVPVERARELYRRGRRDPLPRDDYLELQDHLVRHIFASAGRVGLAVHIHSGHGVPPFLRIAEADVRNLDPVLTDPRLFGTQFVLIHGGAPLHDDAAYLALKPHVWTDISAMTFLYPVPDLARALRTYLIFSPEKTMFGTDVMNYPGVPVGPELQHVALSRSTREALNLALAHLVRDGAVDLDWAVRIGRGVLRDNAARLYGFGNRHGQG